MTKWERGVNPCTWLSLSALQSEARPASVTPGKSLHPVLTAGTQPHSRVHNYMYMHMHICTERILADSACFSQPRVHDLYVHTRILFQLSSYWQCLRSRCNLVHSSTHYDFPAEYQWTLQGAFEINHSTLLLADSRPRTLIFFFFLSISHYIVVAVHEWFCIIHASYSPGCHSGSADDTDAKLNGSLGSRIAEASGMWKENASDL